MKLDLIGYFFFLFTVSAVVQAVNKWFIQRFVTWNQRKGVCFTWRSGLYRTQPWWTAEVKVLVLISMTQSSGLIRGGFLFWGREGGGGCHWSKVAAKETSQVATKPSNYHVIKAWDICHICRSMLRIFSMLNSLFANYLIVYRSDEGLTLEMSAF